MEIFEYTFDVCIDRSTFVERSVYSSSLAKARSLVRAKTAKEFNRSRSVIMCLIVKIQPVDKKSVY